jgi:RNA polymerase sigma-B factor
MTGLFQASPGPGGLTQTEIAGQVGLSQMHVSRLLSRTLTQLRRQLAAD